MTQNPLKKGIKLVDNRLKKINSDDSDMTGCHEPVASSKEHYRTKLPHSIRRNNREPEFSPEESIFTIRYTRFTQNVNRCHDNLALVWHIYMCICKLECPCLTPACTYCLFVKGLLVAAHKT
jgi:hypothetical protein